MWQLDLGLMALRDGRILRFCLLHTPRHYSRPLTLPLFDAVFTPALFLSQGPCLIDFGPAIVGSFKLESLRVFIDLSILVRRGVPPGFDAA